MIIEITPTENDDKSFVQIVEQIVNVGMRLVQPKEISIVKIDSWFDFKWLGFMGKALGSVGMWNDKELRIPPFIPDRVLEEHLYFQRFGEVYEKQELPGLHIYQTSGNNITGKRKLVTFKGYDHFYWFSGNTNNSKQGSLMFYQIGKNNQNIWYVSFLKKDEWQIYKTKNISKNEVKSMLENDYLALIR